MPNKVIVAIEIESCQECPHFYPKWENNHAYCLEEDREVPNISEIAPWCPFIPKYEKPIFIHHPGHELE